MRKWVAWALLVAASGVSSVAGAQSLEQDYARLCAGTAKASETCIALRGALMDKLASDGVASKPAAKGPAATVKPGKVGPGWRLYGALAGKTLIDETGAIRSYEWQEKGAVLKSTTQTERGELVTRFELKTDGTLMVLTDGKPPVPMEPIGKSSFAMTDVNADGTAVRLRYSPVKAGIEIIEEKLDGKAWVATGNKALRKYATPAALAEAKAKLAAAQKAYQDRVVTAEWKALGKMAGKDYLYRLDSGTSEDQVLSVGWRKFGEQLEIVWNNYPSGKRARAITITRDVATGALAVGDSSNYTGTATIDDQKLSILWTSDKTGRGTAFVEFIPTSAGLTQMRGRVKKTKRRDEEKFSYADVTGFDRRKIEEAAALSLAQRKEAARQQQMAQQSSGGDNTFGRMLGGALMGAMLGGGGQSSVDLAIAGAQAAAGGGNTYEVLTSMGSVAQAQAEQSKRELDATIARAQAQAAEDRARQQREEAAAAEARALAQAETKAANAAEASRLREQAARDAAEAKAAAADAKRKADEAARQQAAAAEKARRDEAARLAEAERNRPVPFKEGIVLCSKSGNEWRCPGPLQVTYANLEGPNWVNQIGMACGSSRGVRDIGTYGGYRAFGCGFGIHPTLRDYPGNTDVPAQLGVFVDNRRTFHCPKSTDAYCRNP